MTFVSSSDGVQVAVHDLGGDGPTLLIAHATGFHGHAYRPLAEELAGHAHAIAFDFRGHGDTPQPAGVAPNWERYGDDAEAVASSLDTPIVAFGHSMGGACLLMSAYRNPGLFRRLVLFEPIVFPPRDESAPQRQNTLAEGARRRRQAFASFDAAIAHYAAKPPLKGFRADVLDAYVRFGFVAGEDGQVHLRCRPETEADTFDGGPHHRTWDVLEQIEVPTLVISGRVDEMQASAVAAPVADRLPRGSYLEQSELDHFGPFSRPDLVADVVRRAIA